MAQPAVDGSKDAQANFARSPENADAAVERSRLYPAIGVLIPSDSAGLPLTPQRPTEPTRYSRHSDRSASLPFFAKNLLISAFIGSRKQCWLCLHGAMPVGVGEPCTKRLVRHH
jgi:hypothetical protein